MSGGARREKTGPSGGGRPRRAGAPGRALRTGEPAGDRKGGGPSGKTPAARDLLARPGGALTDAVDKALDAVADVFPVPPAHRADLPLAVRDLSRLLTRERGGLARSYWSAPRLLSAYLYFFLPWNLFRLAWLLPGLNLPLRPGASVLDLGSGPLTLPLALWCARPDLRARPLHFTCGDVSPKIMETGRDIFSALAGPDSPWSFSLLRAPLDRALKQRKHGGFDCITAANVLNEASAGRDPESERLEERLEELLGLAAARLAPEGRLLLLEPGTRLGGRIIALCRAGALRRGLVPLAPCTHSGPCPMPLKPAEGRASRRPSYSGWCHFTHPAKDAPEALLRLAARARLEKEQLSLSCLLLAHGEQGGPVRAVPAGAGDVDELEALYEEIMAGEPDRPVADPPPGPPGEAGENALPESLESLPARIISGPIRLPGREQSARYACCALGLALVEDAGKAPSGAAIAVAGPGRRERDPKSGALLLRRRSGDEAPERPARDRSGHTRPSSPKPPPPRPASPGAKKSAPAGTREKPSGQERSSSPGRAGKGRKSAGKDTP